MELVQRLLSETKDSTVSIISYLDKDICFILEDGYRPLKVYGETRIPEGTYNLFRRNYGRFFDKYKRQHNHKYVYELENVNGFSSILIHKGNSIKDTRGCLLPNEGVIKVDGNYKGVSSTQAYFKLYDILEGNNNITLKIIR